MKTRRKKPRGNERMPSLRLGHVPLGAFFSSVFLEWELARNPQPQCSPTYTNFIAMKRIEGKMKKIPRNQKNASWYARQFAFQRVPWPSVEQIILGKNTPPLMLIETFKILCICVFYLKLRGCSLPHLPPPPPPFSSQPPLLFGSGPFQTKTDHETPIQAHLRVRYPNVDCIHRI